ncbi:MAG: hypothetical protein DRN53_03635 [Thermoprotei archaeon]|nr:MAG: hypothetical protein DRN53_03635 [Thermoprotei archaeon]
MKCEVNVATRKKDLLFIVALALLLLSIIEGFHQVEAIPSVDLKYPEYTWYIDVMKNGSAKIRIIFRAHGNGTSLMYLPKYEKYTLTVVEGTVIIQDIEEEEQYYFYNLVKIRYISSSSVTMVINYTFRYASLILEDDAWFMTPLIGVSDNSTVRVIILLSNFKRYVKIYPHIPEHFSTDDTRANITYILRSPVVIKYQGITTERYLSKGIRICINYRLSEDIPSERIYYRIDNSTIVFETPAIYRDFTDKLVRILKRAKPILEKIFEDFPESLEIKFFLPDLIELDRLGFIYSSVINTGESGPINLNLALTRFMPGYPEQALIHEYIHVALGRIGIKATPQLRWFHEGLAEYLSFYVCKKINVNVTSMEEDRLKGVELFKREVSRNLGEVVRWHSGPYEGLYYSASYYVVKRIGDKYGGVEFYKKLFREAKNTREVKTISKLFELMARVGGPGIYSDLRNMGFSTEVLPINMEYIMLVLIIVLIVITVLYLRSRGEVKEEYKICPFCKAKISKHSTLCNYCGRILNKEIELSNFNSQ